MFAHRTTFQLNANSGEEFRRITAEEFLPHLRLQKGFFDSLLLMTDDDAKAVSITFWEQQEDAETYLNEAHFTMYRMMDRVVKGAPVSRTYVVAQMPSRVSSAYLMPAGRFED